MVAGLMRDFGVNAAVLGNLAALYFYAYATMQLPAGVMVDRWGPRRVLTGAIMLCASGSLLFATADDIGVAYAGRLLIGVGAGFSWVGCLKLVSLWFPPSRFAMVGGACSMLGMAGGVGALAPLAALIQVTGWRATLIGAAVFGGVLAATVWLVVRDGPRPVPRRSVPRPAPGSPVGVLGGLFRVAATPQVWLVALFGAMLVPNLAAFAGLWGVPYMMQAHGLERPAAAAAVSLVLIGFGVAGPLVGWWSDRIGRRKGPMLAGASVALAAVAALVYAPGISVVAAYSLCLLYGTASSVFVLAFATGREHGPADAAGAALGLVNMTIMTVGAVFQPLIGWLLDLNWDGRVVAGARIYSVAAYQTAFLTLIASSLAEFLVLALIRETHCAPVSRATA
jgi:MFS family permease